NRGPAATDCLVDTRRNRPSRQPAVVGLQAGGAEGGGVAGRAPRRAREPRRSLLADPAWSIDLRKFPGGGPTFALAAQDDAIGRTAGEDLLGPVGPKDPNAVHAVALPQTKVDARFVAREVT